ncbi:diaminopimelate decarboxylase [Lentisphaera marina]|uniref:diaminopimelate decarboxylase n=1 Tax=Lentisphaera marina TaxID=1111041 RepID=UPI002365563F|nr:diaminopimelate decarboxylase [Lentisphaera marina]MDD7986801.1 diaminopimelate decarboxylase [Lentisphaera marina]
MQNFTFLNNQLISTLTDEYHTPFYVYSQKEIEKQCQAILAIPAPFGLTARYAIKANPNTAILKIIENTGFHFDASSEYEVIRCLKAGIAADKIQLTSQEMSSEHLELIIKEGVRFNACSLEQLRRYAALAPRNSEISIRINPGLGSGSSRKTNVGGPSSSFGIWYEQVEEVKALAEECGLRITRLHSHVGSGADPAVWERAASLTLAVARQLPEVKTLNLGGGFKVARHAGEVSTSIEAVGQTVADVLKKEAEETGRNYHLELEPGTFLVANAGSLVCSIDDITHTGDDGYTFLKINAGMDMLTRPALYAAHHPCIPVSDSDEQVEYVITGHCCESGDLFSVSADDTLEPRLLPKSNIGDTVIIEGAGAYCASMSLKNYNSFPQVAELILDHEDKAHIIKKRETMEQILVNEVLPSYL